MFTSIVNTKLYDIAFFSNRDIEAGEELTFDYSGDGAGNDVGGTVWKSCLCGSKQCRGLIQM